jgi:flagellar motility protein MotE (MotC chaperone)
MKITLTVLGLLAALGVLYGLAFLGIIPVQKWADRNPVLGKTLAQMHLAVIKPKKAPKTAALPKPDPQQLEIQAEQQQIVADRAQLEKDKTAFETEKEQASSAPPATSGPDTRAKLSAIYATMSPDDISVIFAKLPDPVVIQNLVALDEKKAGKILAAMPADRAARLSQQMMAASPTPQQTASNSASPMPQASLP